MDTHQTIDSSQPLRSWLAWAGLLVALYLAVGFVGWGRSLIGTEIWALYYAGQPFNQLMQAIRNDLVHPPLIYMVERAWLHLFGQTDNAAKALALVINLPTLVLFTWLATLVTRRWRLASFLFCGTYLTVGSTPNQMRMYGLGLLWTVAAILLWDWWRKEPRASRLIAWTVVMMLLVYTHFFGLVLLAAFWIVNWLYGARRWAFTAATALTGLVYLPWLLYVLPVYVADGLATKVAWVNKPHRALAALPSFYLGYLNVPGLRFAQIAAAAVVHLALFWLAWRTVRRLWPPRRDSENQARWFWTAALLAGVPIVLLFGFSVVVTPVFHPRFVLGALPGYWLLVVLLGEFGGRAGRVMLYGIVLPWVLVSIGVALGQSLVPTPVRQGTLLLARELRPTDLILCSGVGNQMYWEWTRRLGRSGRIEVLRPGPTDWRLSVLPQTDLDGLDLGGVGRVWFFYSAEKAVAPVKEFLAAQGFVLETPRGAETPFLLTFAKTGPP